MSLKTDIQPYIDGNNLVAPNVVVPGTIRASDNGPLYTSQYLLLSVEFQPAQQVIALSSCIDSKGNLHRSPGDVTQDAPDDYYGVLSYLCHPASLLAVNISLPIQCYQPALIYMNLLAKNNLLAHLLSPLIAIIIATSNINEDVDNTSNKMLMWTMIKGVEKRSVLCELAGKIWTWRMNRIYVSGTKDIAIRYFGANHPFVKYWK